MSKKHEKKPHIVRDEPPPAEKPRDVASGETPIDSEPPKFGPAWLGAPRAVPSFPDRAMEARANYAATLAEIDRRTGRVACTTCGNPVAPGATCAVDGQIAPRG
jgi:hypothetical protein